MDVKTGRSTGVAAAMMGACALMLSACTSGSLNSPIFAIAGTSTVPSTADLTQLAIAPNQFPSGYSANRLQSEQASAVLSDLSGRGGTVTPAQCAPPVLADNVGNAVVVTGMSEGGGNLTVVVTRSDRPLSEYADAVSECPRYSVANGPVTSTVTQSLRPPSPVKSDESIAYTRVSTSGTSQTSLAQSSTVLAAQNNGVRVYAAFVGFGNTRLDGEALDAVFTTAVQRSRGR